MKDLTQTPPAIKISVTQLQCTACGAETHATCNCGKPYTPKLHRAAKAVAQHPYLSNRVIADEIGVDEKTVRDARAELRTDSAVDEPRIGKDGKTRQLPTKPQPEPDTPVVYEFKADRSLALQIIDIGCKAMASRLQGSRDGIARLNRVRGEMRSHWDRNWF